MTFSVEIIDGRAHVDPLDCHQCRKPFDPTDDRWNGMARYHKTDFCRGCVDRCHDNEIADHRCRVCAGAVR